MPKQGKIFIMSGPSGSGKTTLYRYLLQSKRLKGKIIKAVSVTTRDKRNGEVHGRDYYFISKKMFRHKERMGHFLESEKVFDNYYGTPKRAVFEQVNSGKSVILCIDVKGAKTVKRKIKKAVTIFIKTRTLAELKKRLSSRATETAAKRSLRLQRAKSELREAPAYDYILINDKIPKSLHRLESIVLKEIEN